MSGFDERARDWDTPARQERAVAVADAIRAWVALDPTMRVIDVGAGTGLLGLTLAGEVSEVVLAEPSQGMLDVVRGKLAANGPSNATAIRLDLVEDEVPPDPFDLVVSLLMLHHIADTKRALAAVRRLLRPGGRIALVDLDAEDGSFHHADAKGIHHQGFERQDLIAMARAAGFADVEIRTASEIERDGRRYPLFLLLARAEATTDTGSLAEAPAS